MPRTKDEAIVIKNRQQNLYKKVFYKTCIKAFLQMPRTKDEAIVIKTLKPHIY